MAKKPKTGILERTLNLTSGLGTGIVKDTHDVQTPLWKDGRNIVVLPDGIYRLKGWDKVANSIGSRPPRGIAQLRESTGVLNLFWGDKDSLYRWYSGAATEVGTGYIGIEDATINQIASSWSFANWGNWLLATNGVDRPQIWKGGEFSELVASFTKAEIFLQWGAHILAFNTSNNPNYVEWCSADDVETWTPLATNSAGNLLLRDMESQIIAATHIGSRIAVYGEDSMGILTYSGFPYYFGFTPQLKQVGAVSKYSVIPVGSFNFGFGIQGFFKTDGTGAQAIDTGTIRRFVLDDINWSQKSKICGFHDEDNLLVAWFYPTADSTENNIGVGYFYNLNQWTIFDFARTAGSARNLWNYPVLASPEGEIYFHNHGDDADGEDLKCWIETKAFDFGLDGYKFLQALKLNCTSDLQDYVVIDLYGLEDLSAEPELLFSGMVDPSNNPVYPLKSARWFKLKLTSVRGEVGITGITGYLYHLGGSL